MSLKDIKVGGAASFVYGQHEATLRLLREREKEVEKLTMWATAAEENKFPKLAAFLKSHADSLQAHLMDEDNEVGGLKILVSEAIKLDQILEKK